MKRHRFLLVALVVSMLASCGGTLEIGIDQPVPSPTVSAPPARSGLLYLREGTLYLLTEGGEQALGRLPEEAGYLALGSRYLAYTDARQLIALDLNDGTSHPLLDLPNRPGEYLLARWANDGLSLAYALAWDEADGSRVVELGTTDGYSQQLVDTVVARPARAVPTLPPEPPAPPEPGFATLDILDYDRAAGKLVVTPVGGQEHRAWVGTYDLRGGKFEKQGWSSGINSPQAIALSPDMALLAIAVPHRLWIYRADNLGIEGMPVELPEGTHATWLSWSPDGRRLAYLLNEGESPGLEVSPALGLWIWEIEGRRSHQVASAFSPEASLLGWTADGDALVLVALDGIARQRTMTVIDMEGQTRSIPLPESGRELGWIGEAWKIEP